jgi:hypothetical protein
LNKATLSYQLCPVKAIKDIPHYTILNYVKNNVENGTNLMTNESPTYQYSNKLYHYQKVKHSKKEYVREMSTQTPLRVYGL